MDKSLLGSLAAIVGEENVRPLEPLAPHITFKIGGPADAFVSPRSVEEVSQVVCACEQAGVPWRVIGCGSDLLVSDEGVEGVVIEVRDNLSAIRVDDTRIVAGAGATNAAVAEAACAAGLSGYEFACGIPGTVGGAAIMNAGAYDGEFKDVAVSVSCLFPDGTVREIPAEEADWSYRHSMMSDKGLVVLGATLQLASGNKDDIRAKMDDLSQRRSSKQPLEMASAGSTFKRPEGYFAGKLIQDSGMQGHSVGDAQVSTKHAGFVVNTGNASAADVLQVIRDVQAAVADQFGVTLETEVRMWGFDPTNN